MIEGSDPAAGARPAIGGLPGQPRTLAIAAKLWRVVGGLFVIVAVLGSFGQTVNGPAQADGLTVVIGLLFAVSGVAILILGGRLKRGSDTRIPLTALSVIIFVWWLAIIKLLLFVAVLPLVVPAIILQYWRTSNRWFTALRERPPAR